jgi:hypothetical protein
VIVDDDGVEVELLDETAGPGGDVFDEATGKVRRCASRCTTCIIGGEESITPMLAPGRLKDLIERAADSYVVCHSTIPGRKVQAAVCRGWYEKFGAESNWVRTMGRLIGFVDVEIPEKGVLGGAGDQRGGRAGDGDGGGAGDSDGAGGVRRADADEPAEAPRGEVRVRQRDGGAGDDVGGGLVDGMIGLAEVFKTWK